MGCAPSNAGGTTIRQRDEVHDDGRPLTELTDIGFPTHGGPHTTHTGASGAVGDEGKDGAAMGGGSVNIEKERDEVVDDLAEFFLFDDFKVSTKPPKLMLGQKKALRTEEVKGATNEVKDGGQRVKRAIWGEIMVDEGIFGDDGKDGMDSPKQDSVQPLDGETGSGKSRGGLSAGSSTSTDTTLGSQGGGSNGGQAQRSPTTITMTTTSGNGGAPQSPTSPRVARRPYKTIDKFNVNTAIGHGSRVKCIAIAPGEKEYVSCSNEDTSITMFGLNTGRELGMFTGHQDTIINSTFSYDGKYLATTSRDHTMILWDVVTTKQILTFEHGKVVICCCFSKDSRYVATGCQDKVCRVWETRKGREVLIFAQHEGIIIAMCYAPDNSYIVSASADKTLRVWSSQNGRCRHLLQGHAGIVLSCVYTADGKRIVSNDEKLLRVWNAVDGSCTLSLNVDEVAKIPRGPAQRKVTWTLSTAAPGEFGHYVIVACNNRFVYILDAENKGQEVTSHFCKAPVYCLAMGHNNRAAVGDSFGNVYHFHFQSRDDFKEPTEKIGGPKGGGGGKKGIE